MRHKASLHLLARTGKGGLAALFLVSMCLSLQVVSVAPAHAAPGDLSCTGWQTLNYSPGLTFTPQTVSVSGSGTFTCTSAVDSSLTAGSFTIPAHSATLNCGLIDRSGSYTYQWNNSQSSTITASSVVYPNAGFVTVVSTGTVISGQFTGDAAVFNWTGYSPGLLDCFLGGVTSYSGATLLTFA